MRATALLASLSCLAVVNTAPAVVLGPPHDAAIGTGTSSHDMIATHVVPRRTLRNDAGDVAGLGPNATQWVTFRLKAEDYFRRFDRDHVAVGLWSKTEPYVFSGRGLAIGSVGNGRTGEAAVRCGTGPGQIGFIVESFESNSRLHPSSCRTFDLPEPGAGTELVFDIIVHANAGFVAYQVFDASGERIARAVVRAPTADPPRSYETKNIWLRHTNVLTEGVDEPALVHFQEITDGFFTAE